MPLPLYYFNFLFLCTSGEVLEAFVSAGITKKDSNRSDSQQLRVGVSCKNTVVPFSDRIDATFKGGGANMHSVQKCPELQ